MATASAPIVTIASFKLCSCTQFTGRKDHFKVSESKAELSAVSATAISYTWGEFDRREHFLGHWTDNVKRGMSFQLGIEWDLTSFIRRLVQLTTTYEGVWIDQACLPQGVSDEEWADVLMTIPLVFKTLPVIALLPGRLCRCLTTAYRQYRAAAQGPQEDAGSVAFGTSKGIGEAYERLRDVITGTECIYSNGWCSWIDRIWPSEELRYSRQISVCWVEAGFADCRQPGNPALTPEELTGLPRLLYRARQKDGATHEDIVKEIRLRASRWTRGLWLAIGENLQDYSETASPSSFSLVQRKSEDMARFLLGEVMQLGQNPTTLSDLFRFVWACEILAQTSRQATKPYDYIFSVWADWPSYRVPRSFSSLTCFELLADALDQFKSGDYQVFVPSSSPAGLVDCCSTAESWKFICDLGKDPVRVKDTRDVYRPMFWLSATSVIDSAVPLHIEPASIRAREPQLVKDWIAELSESTVLECVLEFKYRIDLGFIADVVRAGTNHSIYDPYSLLGNQNLDVDAIFDFVCFSLNLDSAKCRRANLQVMCVQRQVTTGSHSSQSTTTTTTTSTSGRAESANVTCFGLANWTKLHEARRLGRGHRVMSVNLRDEKSPFYEVAASRPEQDGRFSIFGVWVPLASVCECSLEAYICQANEEDINALLV